MTCVTLDIRQAGSPLHQCRGAPEKADREGSIIIIIIIVLVTGVVLSIVSTVFLIILFSPGGSVHLNIKVEPDQADVGSIWCRRSNICRNLQYCKLDLVWNSKLDLVWKKFVASTWKLFPNWIQFGIPNWIQFRKSCDFKCSCSAHCAPRRGKTGKHCPAHP